MQRTVNCVDLVNSFLTSISIYLQESASIQPSIPPVPSVFEDSPVYQPASQPAEHEPFHVHNFSSLQGFNFHRAVVSVRGLIKFDHLDEKSE